MLGLEVGHYFPKR